MHEEYDVLIIGAGLSGIGMACHLKRELPDKRVAILERRNAIGGTWDLFRYPGVRSDSDMFTMGYDFRPWMSPKVLAKGSQIRDYITQTAREYGVEKNIQFGVKVVGADWSSERQQWQVSTVHEATGEVRDSSCRVLIICAGYYNYDNGYLPKFPGIEQYKGQCVHPQFWPEPLDYRDKKVLVIGSGATAVTIVPAMAGDTAHVTMLQRSPSYFLNAPSYGGLLRFLENLFPKRWVYRFARSCNIGLQRLFYNGAIRWPEVMRDFLLGQVKKALGKDCDMRHFTPKYMPWEQRLCVVPNGDFFKAIKSGKASVVTDEIETFTEQGVRLKSGEVLDADIVITATGLQLQTFGGMELSIDGNPVRANHLLSYKSVLMQNLPNLALIVGYVNASWTLKADIASRYICRLISHMDEHRYAVVIPRAPDGEASDESAMNALSSGYIKRGNAELPRQGHHLPWRVLHAYGPDRKMLLDEPIADEWLEFDTK